MPKLLTEISAHYKAHKRQLPWRNTKDPYHILVSELMLQQTQVNRVIPKYQLFLKHFPNFQALAQAPLSKVLLVWSGLGYNRRAKYLHQAAKVVVEKYRGKFPRSPEVLETLPGVGHYTARAILAFAYDLPDIFIETNIRTVFTHFFFPKAHLRGGKKISDRELVPFIQKALALAQKEGMGVGDFYGALMDYGAFLKQSGIQLNAYSMGYNKQSSFKGSARQLRGAIVRKLLESPLTLVQLCAAIPRDIKEIKLELMKLKKEKLIVLKGKKFSAGE